MTTRPSATIITADAAPSRRALLAGLLGGIGAWAASAMGRAAPAEAAIGDNLKAGSTVSASGATSGVTNNSDTNATWYVTQNGDSTAIRARADTGTGGRFTTTARNKWGLVASNAGGSGGSGAAIQANATETIGIEANSTGHTAIIANGFYNGAESYSVDSGGNGVYAVASGGTNSYGVWGTAAGPQSRGVYGYVTSDTGENFGVYGRTASLAAGWAGYFENDVYVGGQIIGPVMVSQVDDPSSPTTRWLQHAGVESSERLRINSGTVTLDSRGAATVQLPSWYAAIHTDARYQLTAIGAAAPRLHVARELDDSGSFAIAGGAAGQRVSWLLTSLRNDPFARAHPIANLQAKPAWRQGTYSHPELYGASKDLGPSAFMAKAAPSRP